jgi:hypothetical protein
MGEEVTMISETAGGVEVARPTVGSHLRDYWARVQGGDLALAFHAHLVVHEADRGPDGEGIGHVGLVEPEAHGAGANDRRPDLGRGMTQPPLETDFVGIAVLQQHAFASIHG